MVFQKVLSVLAAGGLILAVAACDQSEQGRVLRYEKGTYLGKTDSSLSDAQREKLRARTMLQGG